MNRSVSLQSEEEVLAVCGSLDQNLELLNKSFDVTIIPRGRRLIIDGQPADVETVARLLEKYLKSFRADGQTGDFTDFIRAWSKDPKKSRKMIEDLIMQTRDGQPVYPRTVAQENLVSAIRDYAVVFAIGPAGTGKTYLSMAMALSYLNKGRFSRIILTRPAVEAGENLGFLPGDLQEKVNPYLRPLYDAFYNLVDIRTCEELLEEGVIEVVPLAFMRGRTLSDSVVILDEAQNTTVSQMKMFLTRLGPSSCSIINGDVTQIDLPDRTESGLVHASRILQGVEGVKFVRLGREDVVRHPIVQNIIDAYEQAE